MSAVGSIKVDMPQQVLSLYRNLLRQGQQFAAYNFREYAKRRTRDAFRENRGVQDPVQIQELVQKGLKELRVMKRQTIVSQFYQLDRLVVEGGISDTGVSGSVKRQRHHEMNQSKKNLCSIEPEDDAYGESKHELHSAKRTKNNIIPSVVLDEATVATTTSNTTLTKPKLAPYQVPVNAGKYQAPCIFASIEPTRGVADAQRIPRTRTALTNIMPPGTRRANRSGYAEHDDFEGLPIRQWRYEWVNVATQPQQEQQYQNDVWAIELPYGMPKDSHLLPPHSQELLRAARSGRLYKRPAQTEDEDGETETAAPEKPEKKEEEAQAQGFSVKVWKQIPRNVEANTVSHLAKRRKGTVTIASRTVPERPTGPMVTRVTVRRTDAAGNPYTEEVTLAKGQPIEGDIVSTRVEMAVGTSTELQAITGAPPPNKRRPPPPKRKTKSGPGRGKKKIKHPVPNLTPNAGGITTGDVASAPLKLEDQGENGISREDTNTPNPDSEMADVDDDDDDGDGDGDGDGHGDGDDSDDVDKGDGYDTTGGDKQNAIGANSQDVEMEDGVSALTTAAAESPVRDPKIATAPKQPRSPSPHLLALPMGSLASGSSKPEGSPLKNVLSVPCQSTASENLQLPDAELVQLPEAETQSVSQMAIQLPSVVGNGAPGEAATREISNVEHQTQPGTEATTLAREELRWRTSQDLDTTNDEPLLPPPDQVGNIDSPKVETATDKSPDVEERVGEGQGNESEGEALPPRFSLAQPDSVMTEYTIKPDDSASTRFPLTESEPLSDVGTISIGETKEPPSQATGSWPQPSKPSSPPDEQAISEEIFDLIGGLIGELDRQATSGVKIDKSPTPPPDGQRSVGELQPGAPCGGINEPILATSEMEVAAEPAPATISLPEPAKQQEDEKRHETLLSSPTPDAHPAIMPTATAVTDTLAPVTHTDDSPGSL